MARHGSKTTTDHDEIRRWAEARGGRPACVRGTGSGHDPGMIRLDFPGYSGADKLQPISWDEWFRAFDENGLALVYQETTADGELSNFNKLVARTTARARAHGESHASRRRGTTGGTRSGSRSNAGRGAAKSGRSGSWRRSTKGSSGSSRASGRTKKSSGAKRSGRATSKKTTSRAKSSRSRAARGATARERSGGGRSRG